MSDPRSFVKIINPKTQNMVIINTIEGCRDFIMNLPEDQQGEAIWYSIKAAFQIGTKVGNKRAWQEAARKYNVPNPYEGKKHDNRRTAGTNKV